MQLNSMVCLLGGVQLLQAVDKDVQEDVADAGAPRELIDGQVLAAAVQHLAVAHRIAVQQLQQESSPVAKAHSALPAEMIGFRQWLCSSSLTV